MNDSGYDWNGNGHRDAGDSYIDYEIMNDNGGGSDYGAGGRSSRGGCGCVLAVIIIVVILLSF